MTAVDEILVGGNHLANFLIGKLGPAFSKDFPPDANAREVAGKMPNDVYDVWVCWAAIMRAKFIVKQ